MRKIWFSIYSFSKDAIFKLVMDTYAAKIDQMEERIRKLEEKRGCIDFKIVLTKSV